MLYCASPDDIYGTRPYFWVFPHEGDAGGERAVYGEDDYARVWRENEEEQVRVGVITSTNSQSLNLSNATTSVKSSITEVEHAAVIL